MAHESGGRETKARAGVIFRVGVCCRVILRRTYELSRSARLEKRVNDTLETRVNETWLTSDGHFRELCFRMERLKGCHGGTDSWQHFWSRLADQILRDEAIVCPGSSHLRSKESGRPEEYRRHYRGTELSGQSGLTPRETEKHRQSAQESLFIWFYSNKTDDTRVGQSWRSERQPRWQFGPLENT